MWPPGAPGVGLFSEKLKKLKSGAKFPNFAPQTGSRPSGTKTDLFSDAVPTPAAAPVCLDLPATPPAPPASISSMATGHPPPAPPAAVLAPGLVRHPLHPSHAPRTYPQVTDPQYGAASPPQPSGLRCTARRRCSGAIQSCSGWSPPTYQSEATPVPLSAQTHCVGVCTGPGGCARFKSIPCVPGARVGPQASNPVFAPSTVCVPDPASPIGVPNPPAASSLPQAHLGTESVRLAPTLHGMTQRIMVTTI